MADIPDGLSYWTADEVAECLEYYKYLSKDDGDTLYKKLWQFLNEASNPTPLGGDGTNGTVEYPCGRQSLANDDKAGHWWGRLNEAEQAAVRAAYTKATTL